MVRQAVPKGVSKGNECRLANLPAASFDTLEASIPSRETDRKHLKGIAYGF